MADCKIVYYNSTTSSIQLGDFLYQNQAQTIPAGAGFYAWTNDDKWYQTDAEGVVISSGSCSPIGNIFTGGLAGSFLMGCITSSLSFGLVDNSWNDSYYTSSGNYSFVLWTGTGSRDTQNPAIQTTTASFQAYDFSFPYRYVGTTVDPAQQYNYGTILNTIGSGLTSTSASNELTAQIWGAINFNDTSSTYGYYSGSQIGLLEIDTDGIAGIESYLIDNWRVYYSSSQQLLYVSYFTGSNSTPSASVSMSIASGNYPMDRLSLYTMKFSGSNFQFLSGSTIVANTTLPKTFRIQKSGSGAGQIATEAYIARVSAYNNNPAFYRYPFVGYMNSALFYTTSLSLERIEQNTYSLINGYTSSVNLRGCIEPVPNYPSLNGLVRSLPYGGISYLNSTEAPPSPEFSSSYNIRTNWFDGYQPSKYPGSQSVYCPNAGVTCSYLDDFDDTSNLNFWANSVGSFGNLNVLPFYTLNTSTASFEAYDFNIRKTQQNSIFGDTYATGSPTWFILDSDGSSSLSGRTSILNPTNTSNGFTLQIWGALNPSASSNCGIYTLLGGTGLNTAEVHSIYTRTSGALDTDKQFVFNKYNLVGSTTTLQYAVSMSITGANWPMNRLSLTTFIVSGSTFSAYSGSTLIGSRQLPQPFNTLSPTGSTDRLLRGIPLNTTSSINSGSFVYNFNDTYIGFVNHQLIYKRPITINEIQQNLNSFINNYTSSIDKNNGYKPPITPATTTTTSTTTTTTTSTTTTTTSTSTTTTLGPQIITRGLSSYLNFRNFYSASLENNDLWYDSVQLVSESACSRVIGIDSADEGCGENRPDCPVFLSTGSFNAWDWPNVFNCNKSVFFPTGAFASSSNQTYVFYGAWDKDSNYGFVRNRNYQTSLQRANKIYSSGSNIVLETYWNNGTTHTLDLPISASTFTSSSLSMLTVRVENGNTASVFQNGNLILTKETSSLNFQSQNLGYTYWLDSDDVSDYTMFAHSMLIYTASLTNNEISALSTAINNNITGSY